jgi:hypothetical protein
MWYYKVVDDLSVIPQFIQYYTNELTTARKEVKIEGNLETNIKLLPGIVEFRFNQLEDIESVLKHLEILYDELRVRHYKKYLEAYNRALSSRDADKYASGDKEVIEFQCLVNEVALLRNQYLAIHKGLDVKQWQLGHITKLRTVGMEDITL